MNFTWINQTVEETTLKKFLQIKGVSHRLLTKIKHDQGKVLINGRNENLTAKVNKEDEVTLILPPEKADKNVAMSDKPLEIIYEDLNWLVVNKPTYLSSVPGPRNRTDTLVNRVKFHLWKQKSKDLVPHVITRLDRDTSGVVLVAKHRFAQGLINKQVEEHMIDKRYLAVVEGIVATKHGYIEAPIGINPNGIGQIITPNGKKAKTEFWVKEYLGNQATIVECKLHTGRTHQIRIHFSNLGHALLGDKLYGGKMMIDRQALHCIKLSYTDPFTQIKQEFISHLPKDIEILIKKLKA